MITADPCPLLRHAILRHTVSGISNLFSPPNCKSVICERTVNLSFRRNSSSLPCLGESKQNHKKNDLQLLKFELISHKCWPLRGGTRRMCTTQQQSSKHTSRNDEEETGLESRFQLFLIAFVIRRL